MVSYRYWYILSYSKVRQEHYYIAPSIYRTSYLWKMCEEYSNYLQDTTAELTYEYYLECNYTTYNLFKIQ